MFFVWVVVCHSGTKAGRGGRKLIVSTKLFATARSQDYARRTLESGRKAIHLQRAILETTRPWTLEELQDVETVLASTISSLEDALRVVQKNRAVAASAGVKKSRHSDPGLVYCWKCVCDDVSMVYPPGTKKCLICENTKLLSRKEMEALVRKTEKSVLAQMPGGGKAVGS